MKINEKLFRIYTKIKIVDIDNDIPLKSLIPIDMTFDGFSHHSVLSHKDDGSAPKGHADLLHLLGADIVSAYYETLGVFFEELLMEKETTVIS